MHPLEFFLFFFADWLGSWVRYWMVQAFLTLNVHFLGNGSIASSRHTLTYFQWLPPWSGYNGLEATKSANSVIFRIY